MAKRLTTKKILESTYYDRGTAARGAVNTANEVDSGIRIILSKLRQNSKLHFDSVDIKNKLLILVRKLQNAAKIDTKYGPVLIEVSEILKNLADTTFATRQIKHTSARDAIESLQRASATLMDVSMANISPNSINQQDDSKYMPGGNIPERGMSAEDEARVNALFNNSYDMSDIAARIFNEEFEASLKDEILSLFDDIYVQNSGLTTADILEHLQSAGSIFDKNKIMFELQNLINDKVLKLNSVTKKIYLNLDEDNEEQVDLSEFTETDLTDKVLDYFDTSVTAGVGGISIQIAVKDIKKETGTSKPEIMSCITKLLKNKQLKKGVTPGTIMVNSVEEEESLIPVTPGIGSSDYSNEDLPLTNQETPESLKLKGWKEETPGIFMSPDGKSKYILSREEKSINMHMSYHDKQYEMLCEEFDRSLDEIENADIDNTDGLDEFTDDTADEIEDTDETDGEDDVTVTLTAHEAEVLQAILHKINGTTEDTADYVSDAATDEEANAELMGDDDIEDEDFDSEEPAEEDEEDDIDWDSEDWDFDEDEETVADSSTSGVFDGSFSSGAPTMKKHTPAYDKSGKPITGKGHTPTAHGNAQDCAGRPGAPTMKKHTPAYDKSGKPVNSKVTSGVGKSIFDL